MVVVSVKMIHAVLTHVGLYTRLPCDEYVDAGKMKTKQLIIFKTCRSSIKGHYFRIIVLKWYLQSVSKGARVLHYTIYPPVLAVADSAYHRGPELECELKLP